MTADERLIAYVDGALTPQDSTTFEAEVASDPALAAEVARHRRLAERIAGAYAPVLHELVPPRLTVLAGAANDPVSARWALPQWGAVAASLLLGLVGGRALWPGEGPLALRRGELVARGDLETALTTQLASQQGALAVGLSFKARDGRYCRTFASPAAHLAGLVCRRDGRWVAQTTTAWTPGQNTAYRTAASDTPAVVLTAVDGMIAGPALDAAAERAARDKGWSP